MESRIWCHSRSISLPSTSSHPLENHLALLGQASQFEASSSSICHNLASVKYLYERINELILHQVTQQVLSSHDIDNNHLNGVDKVLEGSLTLLDICGAATDAMSQMKDSILELESSLRRRSSSEVSSNLLAYKAIRRRIIKSVSKCLGNLKKLDHKACLDEDDQRRVCVVMRVLREAQVICLLTLKSLLVFLSGAKTQHGWSSSVVAKLILSSDSEMGANEVEKIDRAVFDLGAKKINADVETTQSVQRQLGALEMAINEIEDGLCSVSRCLVRTRVSLLNVLNH